MIFFKIGRSGVFALECVSKDSISSKHLFHFNCDFAKKSEKFQLQKN